MKQSPIRYGDIFCDVDDLLSGEDSKVDEIRNDYERGVEMLDMLLRARRFSEAIFNRKEAELREYLDRKRQYINLVDGVKDEE